MGDFKLPPYSALAGSTLPNFYKVLRGEEIDARNYFKLFVTQLISLMMTPSHWWEKMVFNDKIARFSFENPPVFILGHWRSGTTLLHNLLCQDAHSAFITTYHSVFPNNLASKSVFKYMMKKRLPATRPGDHMKLGVDYPQEDEFALTNMIPLTYYKFFYFPNHYRRFYERFVRFQGLCERDRALWKRKYRELLAKAVLNTGGSRLIVKNPANTGRIKMLLEMFPEARFIHIHRHPVEVFLSTRKFFTELFPSVWLKRVNEDFIDSLILDIYEKLYTDYFATRELIPKGNLYELPFSELETDPIKHLKRIYDQLKLGDFTAQKEKFIAYLTTVKSHRKSTYQITPEVFESVTAAWKEPMKRLGYATDCYP